eukprot:6519715-Prorocentrum_lima.AAC.1
MHALVHEGYFPQEAGQKTSHGRRATVSTVPRRAQPVNTGSRTRSLCCHRAAFGGKLVNDGLIRHCGFAPL